MNKQLMEVNTKISQQQNSINVLLKTFRDHSLAIPSPQAPPCIFFFFPFSFSSYLITQDFFFSNIKILMIQEVQLILFKKLEEP